MVNRLTKDIEDTAENFVADRNRDRSTGIDGLHPAGEAVGRLHGDAADFSVAELLKTFENFCIAVRKRNFNRVKNIRNAGDPFKDNVYDRSADTCNSSDVSFCHFHSSLFT